jgi:cytoskeletal protein CcmA (bactofilin family)
MAKGKEPGSHQLPATTLGRETRFNGVMRFRESLKIDGHFDGEIHSAGFLYIENGAVVNANIQVGSVVIGGIVEGNIEASTSVEMLATGKVRGNIRTAKLRIADGVVFDGKCEMIREPEKVDIFSGGVAELKKAALGA